MPANKAKPSDKKILIVDDDDSIIAMLKMAFSIEGFEVSTARDGREILKKANQFKPDLIISDLMMPGGGGYEVLRSLQSDPLTQKVPVFMITGSHMAASTKEMMQQEPNLAGYFEKPVRPETLIRAVHKRLNTLSREEERSLQRKEPPTNFSDAF